MEKKSFEQSIARLDEVVRKLERGDVPLDEALALFEEGTGLVKFCSETLTEAEKKVVAFTRKDGETEA